MTPIKVFYSYSHKDEELRDEFQKHMVILKRTGFIEEWHDRNITPGQEWAKFIDYNLESSQIILLLISADFLSSEYCWGIEMKRALEMHEKNQAIVVPIILRSVFLDGSPFLGLQALPKDLKPITSWGNRDEAWTAVTSKIAELCKSINNSQTVLSFTNKDEQVSRKTKEESLSFPPLPNLYSMPPYILTEKFIGREKELIFINNWAKSDKPILVVNAIGGQGKSALAWEWIKRHAETAISPAGIVWWSFYEPDATIEAFVLHTLAYITQKELKTYKEMLYQECEDMFWDELESSRFLVALDGVERLLEAYHDFNRERLPDNQIKDNLKFRRCTKLSDEKFLQRLTTITKSKVLISTRLNPTAFEEQQTGTSLRGVEILNLDGLTLHDARILIFDRGVDTSVETNTKLDAFLKKIGYHSLLIKIAGSEVKNYTQAQGNFDAWYQQNNIKLKLADMAIDQTHKHILEYAFEGLDANKRQILGIIAGFNGPVPYSLISTSLEFNPYLPPKPQLPMLLPLPQTSPSPFGSAKLAKLRHQLSRATSSSEKETLSVEIEKQEKLDLIESEYLLLSSDRLRKQEEVVRQQRKETLEYHDKTYRASEEYKFGLEKFATALSELNNRGLLAWDYKSDTYDIHPLVRSFAANQLPENEKINVFGKIRDHFVAIPILGEEQISDVSDLFNMIEACKALLNTREVDLASEYYRNNLGAHLRNLSAYSLIIELLSPFFNESLSWIQEIKDADDRSYIINDLGIALRETGDIDGALLLFEMNLSSDSSDDNLRRWNKFVDISNFSDTLLRMNRIADARRGYELAIQVISPNDVGWAYLDLMKIYLLLGQWVEAQKYYDLCVAAPEPTKHAKAYARRVQMHFSVLQICQNNKADEALSLAFQLSNEGGKNE